MMAGSALGWSQHRRSEQEQRAAAVHSGGYAPERWARVNYTV